MIIRLVGMEIGRNEVMGAGHVTGQHLNIVISPAGLGKTVGSGVMRKLNQREREDDGEDDVAPRGHSNNIASTHFHKSPKLTSTTPESITYPANILY